MIIIKQGRKRGRPPGSKNKKTLEKEKKKIEQAIQTGQRTKVAKGICADCGNSLVTTADKHYHSRSSKVRYGAEYVCCKCLTKTGVACKIINA